MSRDVARILRRSRKLAPNEFGSVEHVLRVNAFVRAVREAGFVCYVNLAGEVIIRDRPSRVVHRG